MFSATVPKSIAHLAKSYQKNSVRVSTVAEKSQHSDIEYRALGVAARDMENGIINVLRFYEAPNALVFANTRVMVNRLTTRLTNRGFSVVSLSGELSQNERSHALQAMRDGRARICVATDVAARGIDLPNLDLVVHAELPTNYEILMHRSGRTGRAGRKGISVLIVPPSARRKAERILQGAKVVAEWAAPPSADEVKAKDRERLMTDPSWQEEIGSKEKSDVDELLSHFTPLQIAAAYLRLYTSKQSAPEELVAIDSKNLKDSKPSRAADFGPTVWFSIPGGRSSGTVPGRLLPMICNSGGITKHDIGAIKIHPEISYFEIKSTKVKAFKQALGPDMTAEDDVVVTQVDGPPVDVGFERSKSRKPWVDKKIEVNIPSSAPVDWNDDTKPKQRKPKANGHNASQAKERPKNKSGSVAKSRLEGVVESFKKKSKSKSKKTSKYPKTVVGGGLAVEKNSKNLENPKSKRSKKGGTVGKHSFDPGKPKRRPA
jgi:ATP-dependent RNA helicase DeaD